MKDFMLGLLAGLIIGLVIVDIAYKIDATREMNQIIKSGRLSTPNGIYFLVPCPTYQEYNQLQLDLKTYAKVKKIKRGKG
jgi:hypothetical protein